MAGQHDAAQAGQRGGRGQEHGFEFMNLQVGADYALPHGLAIAPFLSFSLGQFRRLSTTATAGATTTTTDDDLAKHSLHEWILLGVRFAFRL